MYIKSVKTLTKWDVNFPFISKCLKHISITMKSTKTLTKVEGNFPYKSAGSECSRKFCKFGMV